ncbi:ABC transporter ATP-binding protein [Agrobacterium tumefaciens]|uniref:ABC transporter ATP-binding protein n=1 Tax=Agrobacterium tumefaciens TaxID=358 RepID=UPI00287CEB51|nr:ABC transporter ATP-binding protein [Agrobacterium tumefaciens]MDS7594268.1 ABC transporter ATP-binding protein [Agrobacterium tumefaciens]
MAENLNTTTESEVPSPLLDISHLSVHFSRSGKLMRAVDNVSLHVAPGETLGLVGESGSGKTTIGRAVLRLLPDANTQWNGSIRYEGTDIAKLSKRDMRRTRGRLQMIFQDPVSSFNPRRKMEDIVAEGLVIQGVPRAERRARVEQALADVGFALADVAGRRPHQFSGGQCQRIAIARALAVQPELIVCDEPVASLDVSVQAHVINLLQDIREARNLALIFISHDLAVVKNVSDRVAVLYMGRIVEVGTGEEIYDRPAHPYTRKLLEAVPVVDASRKIEPDAERAAIPSRIRPPTGCAFRTRCPRAAALCADEEPTLTQAPRGQLVACHFPHDEAAPGMTAKTA